MWQQLPQEAGYPLVVNDIGRVVGPGEKFDCPLPVPGCVPVDAPEGAGDETPPEQPGETGEGQPAAKGRVQKKD
jgi:hypothetical protein